MEVSDIKKDSTSYVVGNAVRVFVLHNRFLFVVKSSQRKSLYENLRKLCQFEIQRNERQKSGEEVVDEERSKVEHNQWNDPLPKSFRELLKIEDTYESEQRECMNRWQIYLKNLGTDIVMRKNPMLLRVLLWRGVPDHLRAHIWQILSGSLYFQKIRPELYSQLKSRYEGVESHSVDEVNKDVRRSLPEHPYFQSKVGISNLREVRTSNSLSLDFGYLRVSFGEGSCLLFLEESKDRILSRNELCGSSYSALLASRECLLAPFCHL